MRNLIMAFIDDPYMAIYQHDLYQNYQNEIDELNIYISGRHSFIIDFISELWSEASHQIIFRQPVRHGEALNELYGQSRGDVLITMDSDNFIFKQGVIDGYCKEIESLNYDIVGSLNYANHINPFMSFWRMSLLNSVAVDFRDKTTKQGFSDVMQELSKAVFAKQHKLKIIPVDNQPYYEHLGRSSALPSVLDYPKPIELNKSVAKAFSRRNRAEKIKTIYELTHDRFPFPDFNAYYKKYLDRAMP